MRWICFFRHRFFIIAVLLGLESSCAYRVVRSTPHLRAGISSVYIDRVENHSGIIGIEGPIRRQLESRFFDYLNASTKDLPKCEQYGSANTYHGMNQTLLFLHKQDEAEQNQICLKRDAISAMVVKINSVSIQPISFITGTATGASLGLQKDALLASTYTIATAVTVEFYDFLIPGQPEAARRLILSEGYSFTSTFSGSTFQSDLTGASRNYLRTQLSMIDSMEAVGQTIADNIFTKMTSIF
jgi:hypothetical protein